MKALVLAIAVSALVAGSVNAAPRDHSNWGQSYGGAHQYKSGERIGYDDWNGAAPINYRQHHLRAPPRGYQWRESNGQYVMAAVATGVIASIILNNNHR